MKTLLLLLALSFLSISNSEGDDSTIDVKCVNKVAKSQDEATKWKLEELPHKDWLSEISVHDWTLLHESETKDWHFAVFRDGDRLIFWKGKKTASNTETQFSVGAPQERKENQPEIAVITHKFSFPGGSAIYYAYGSITHIRGGFKGKIRIEFKVKVGGTFVPAFDEAVEWK